jgi:hypothetical protein
LPQPGNHQAIGLARERRRKNRVALGIARHFQRERDQIPAPGRSTAGLFEHSGYDRPFAPDFQPRRYCPVSIIRQMSWKSGKRPGARPAALDGLMIVVGVLSYAIVAPPDGPRSLKRFDPVRMADLELRMWQSYYEKDRVRLFALLVATLREQYHYSWAVAVTEAFRLARAAVRFSELQSNYDTVLPDLEAAYTTARSWLGADFEPAAVARAELAWWVARRTPGRNNAAIVGGLIADEYVLLYDTSHDLVALPAQLRAEAAALRDANAASPDWETIGRLLQQSYAALSRALSTQYAWSRHPPQRPQSSQRN